MNLYLPVGLLGPQLPPSGLPRLSYSNLCHVCPLTPQSLSGSIEGYIGVAPGRSTCSHLSIICITDMLHSILLSPHFICANFTTALFSLRTRFTSYRSPPLSFFTISLTWSCGRISPLKNLLVSKGPVRDLYPKLSASL